MTDPLNLIARVVYLKIETLANNSVAADNTEKHTQNVEFLGMSAMDRTQQG